MLEEIRFMKNIIIILAGVLIVFFVLNKTKVNAPEVIPEENTEEGVEMKFTSLKGVEIFLTNPLPETKFESPLKISGRAPGSWFFEASAPVTITDWDGLIIAEGYVTAEGDWMTTNYVPFSGTVEFTKPLCEADYCKRGSFILRKDNPSGESKFDDAIEFMFEFK